MGFNYRNAPAVQLARRLVAEGRLGRVEQVRITMLADYAAHPEGALTWRYQNAWAGSGVLGDLVSHGVDLGRHVVGEIASLVCDTATFIPERPALSGAAFAHTARGTGALAPVENEDYAGALLRFADGARGHARVEPRRRRRAVHVRHRGARRPRRAGLGLPPDGRAAGLPRPGGDRRGVRDALVSPGDGDLGAFQPGSGIAMSYDDLKVVEAHRLLRSIASGTPEGATITDALHAARLVDAMAESARERRWVDTSALVGG